MTTPSNSTRATVRAERNRLREVLALLKATSEGQEEETAVVFSHAYMVGGIDMAKWILDRTDDVTPPSIRSAMSLHSLSGLEEFKHWLENTLGVKLPDAAPAVSPRVEQTEPAECNEEDNGEWFREPIRQEIARIRSLLDLMTDRFEDGSTFRDLMNGAIDGLMWVIDSENVVMPSLRMATAVKAATEDPDVMQWIREEFGLGVDNN